DGPVQVQPARHPVISRPHPPRPRDRTGFVLIGVIMFVLALTILGLSLFGLSTYESQFITASLDQTQLDELAQSALERTRYALAVSSRLDKVDEGLPLTIGV